MNNNPFNPETVEATAKASFNNANQIVDLALSKSIELLEKNVQAAKATIDRQANYASSLREARGIEDIVKIQEEIGTKETKALEGFVQEVYQLSVEASSDLAEITDKNRNVTEEMVTDSLEQIAKTIPNGNAQFGAPFFSDLVTTQINAYKAFNNMVEKMVSSQRDSFNTVTQTVGEAVNTKVKAAKVAAKRK